MRAKTLLLLWPVMHLAWAASPRFVIADVVINGISQRPAVICVGPNGELMARQDDIVHWNIDIRQAQPVQCNKTDHISLSSLPDIQARIDGAILRIEADGAAFRGAKINLQKKLASSTDVGTGAYLNYDISSFVTRGQRPAMGASLEGVYYRDTLSAITSGVATDSANGRRFVRYESNVRVDLPDRVESAILGDSVSRSATVARAFRFGGISYGTSFSTRPDLITFPLPNVPGESRVPSAAELLINGQQQTKLQLPAGPFEIANIPAINGAGEIQVITHDALGRQQVLTVPFYVTPLLLSPGLADWGVELGKVREDFGAASFDYGRSFAKGTYRRGINKSVTAEAYAESTGSTGVLGAGVTGALGTFGVTSASVAASTGASRGASVAASFERSSRFVSFGLRGQRISAGFQQLGETPDLQNRFNVNAGLSLGSYGSISLIHAAEKKFGHRIVNSDAISFQKQLGRQLAIIASYNLIRSENGNHRFAGLAVAMPLSTSASSSLAAYRQGQQTEYLAEARESLPADEGWARRIRIDSARNTRVDIGTTWVIGSGQWSADASQSSRTTAMRLGATGSLLYSGGVTRRVRQLGDAFAIVALPGHEDVDIYYENQRVARTDRDGIAIIPRLRPYEANNLAVDTLRLSLSTELKSPRRSVTPARRAGVLIKFDAVNSHGALVSFATADGKPVPAGAMLRIKTEEFPVAHKGEAWVTGLEASADARITWATHACRANIPAPNPSKLRPRIGPLTCVME